MPKRMLIDGTHPEETRVVVMNGNRVEDYDIETSTKKQLKGNIYLAKVTRVEPSLQAAFVDYGGNRHGFLAFGEIHPDYYQIPLEDREALKADQFAIEAEARAAQAHLDDIEGGVVDVVEPPHEHEHEHENEHDRNGGGRAAASHLDHVIAQPLTSAADGPPIESASEPEPDDGGRGTPEAASDPGAFDPATDELDIPPIGNSESAAYRFEAAPERPQAEPQADAPADAPPTAELALGGVDITPDQPQPAGERYGDSAQEALDRGPLPEERAPEGSSPVAPRRRRHRHYRIQEVIKRRQVLLVQVVKEERGNKGAALTTYLSLAGRYCVLMPNTARGGGISRKITNPAARRKLKEMLAELSPPDGMAVIIRTAGIERNKSEVKRDFEYLLRAWDEIREFTLKSTAPALVYEEASLIKRAIRDLYAKDIDEIHVEGDEAYQTAKNFMRLMMPSHAKRVIHYRDPTLPLFHRYQVEGQLDAMHSPVVQLRSGGYIVIHATEALVAIDVNSGRATRERNIEETAYKTNLEAADEVALQLRLRDLAGLIVIDFIDMEDQRNSRSVERRFREAVKNDRARIQLGRISSFGLMELSRQRLRPSLLETSGQVCPHCQGTGHVRSVESSAIRVLRRLEEEGIRARSADLAVSVPPTVALYILNQKRFALVEIENRYNFRITIKEDPALIAPDMKIERLAPRPEVARPIQLPAMPPPAEDELEAADEIAEEEPEEFAEEAAGEAVEAVAEATAEPAPAGERHGEERQGEERRGRRRRRRRGRRGPEDRDAQQPHQPAPQYPADQPYPQQHIPVYGAGAPAAEDEAFEVAVEPPQLDADAALPANGEPGYPSGEPREGGRRRRRRRGRRGGRGRRDGDGQAAAPGFGPQPEFVPPHEDAYEPEPEVSVEPPPPPAPAPETPRPPRPPIDVVPPWRKQQQPAAQDAALGAPHPDAHPAPPPIPEPRVEVFPEARPDVTPPAHVEARTAAPEPAPQVEVEVEVAAEAPKPAPRPEPPPVAEEPPLPPESRRKGWWSKI